MKEKKRLFFIIVSLAILFLLAYSYIIPTKFKDNCNDEGVYKYKFGIYKIDTLYKDKIKLLKLGGGLEFLNISKTKCFEEVEKEYYIGIKAKHDKIIKSQNWKKLRDGLFINKNGEIGFEDQRALNEGILSETYYITKFGFNENPTLKSIIDTATFTELGNTYYKDKNNIYHYYGMAYGGKFHILENVDYKSFQILGDCYAKDKNNIYEMRAGKLDSVDYKTFKTIRNCGCFAKDKNGYYSWDSKISKEYYEEKYIKEAIKKLNQ